MDARAHGTCAHRGRVRPAIQHRTIIGMLSSALRVAALTTMRPTANSTGRVAALLWCQSSASLFLWISPRASAYSCRLLHASISAVCYVACFRRVLPFLCLLLLSSAVGSVMPLARLLYTRLAVSVLWRSAISLFCRAPRAAVLRLDTCRTRAMVRTAPGRSGFTACWLRNHLPLYCCCRSSPCLSTALPLPASPARTHRDLCSLCGRSTTPLPPVYRLRRGWLTLFVTPSYATAYYATHVATLLPADSHAG